MSFIRHHRRISLVALGLLAFGPTKWVNHFGAVAAPATVLIALCLLRSPLPRRPGALVTAICPPDCATMPCTVARPRPVPPRSGRVVKKGSKSRGSRSGAMPVPVSDTSSTA